MTGQIRRWSVMAAAGLVTAGGLALVPATPANAAVPCENPSPPSWFYTRLQEAADYPDDAVPSSWGNSLNIARIVCAESSFNPDAENGQFYGLGQLNAASVAAYSNFSWETYKHGTSANPASYYQLLAALRYCKGRYGDTTAAWEFRKAHNWW